MKSDAAMKPMHEQGSSEQLGVTSLLSPHSQIASVMFHEHRILESLRYVGHSANEYKVYKISVLHI